MEALATFFKAHWGKILEILLISLGAAWAYRHLRPITSKKLVVQFVGGMLLAIIAAQVFKFYLLLTTLLFLLLILVVIFQQELRHAFVAFAGHRFFTPVKNTAQFVDQLEDIVRQLAAKRIGALFAIERSIDLKQFIETGVAIDCELNTPLVLTIFHPKTTLHDGGMVLSNRGRIEGAGCVFPVSQRELLDRSIGLRHRAAMGITEQTDAIAIVVSEETGQISIAYQGDLDQALTPALFTQRLTELLSQEDDDHEAPTLKEERSYAERSALTERPATKRLEA